MFLDDPRTQTVMLEPRVDNTKSVFQCYIGIQGRES